MSGKRQAASPPADEPDAKQAKGDDADAKAGADAENAGAEAGGDDPMETEENGRGDAPARRSLRTRNPVRKAATRNVGKAAKANATETKITQVTYKEGELLSDHLKADGALVEVKIPAECTVNTNQQVRSRQLWGTDVYTSDSDVVAALMHTGFWLPGSTCPPQLLELVATARAVPPAEQHLSTSRNGIRSRSWGRVLTGFSYKVEACRAITVNNQTIELTGDPERIKPCAPTFFPNVVESVVNTRASQANAERRQKLIQEVTIQYNLCNEPWLKYSVASVCDRGFKRSEWTSARLRRETLYLETHARRYELSYDGPVFDEEEENYDEVNAPEADVYRWGRCATPRDLRHTAELGVPLPKEELVDVATGVKWNEIRFDLNSVTIQGAEYKVVRLQWLPRIEPGGELHEDE
mmetsp:Transcript_10745/g.46539  ORF Transcript_10745/g.46539 Transcript_10745/m.46539 type:complete len:410 (-) Transcript_10745:931-2160(-)